MILRIFENDSATLAIRAGLPPDATSAPDADPERDSPLLTAVVEGSGALLRWRVGGHASPDADIHDPLAASHWLADIYGVSLARAVHDRHTGATFPLPAPADTPLLAHASRLASLRWMHAWWPAGRGIPALDHGILTAEIALATAAVEDLLDDDLAVAHALEDAEAALPALASVTGALAEEAEATAQRLTALAEDYGVVLPQPSPSLADAGRTGWALAAGHGALDPAALLLAQGSHPVRWSDVPAQTVAADAEAEWRLLRLHGATSIEVRVPAAPGTPSAAALLARFGPDDLGIDIPLTLRGGVFAGTAVVPAAALTLPEPARTLWVRDPRWAAPDAHAEDSSPGEAEPDRIREAVRAAATARLAAPGSLAERLAAAAAEGGQGT